MLCVSASLTTNNTTELFLEMLLFWSILSVKSRRASSCLNGDAMCCDGWLAERTGEHAERKWRNHISIFSFTELHLISHRGLVWSWYHLKQVLITFFFRNACLWSYRLLFPESWLDLASYCLDLFYREHHNLFTPLRRLLWVVSCHD